MITKNLINQQYTSVYWEHWAEKLILLLYVQQEYVNIFYAGILRVGAGRGCLQAALAQSRGTKRLLPEALRGDRGVHGPLLGPGVGAVAEATTSAPPEGVPEGHGHPAGPGIPARSPARRRASLPDCFRGIWRREPSRTFTCCAWRRYAGAKLCCRGKSLRSGRSSGRISWRYGDSDCCNPGLGTLPLRR